MKATLEGIAYELYRNYMAEARKQGTVTAHIENVIDPICKELRLTRYQFGKQYLEPIQIACLKRELPYSMMLEVDASWQRIAAWYRRKKENQVWVFDHACLIIEMKIR